MAEKGDDEVLKPDPLGIFLREQRLLKRWSMKDMAEEAGVSSAYVANLERGFDYSTMKPVRPSVEKLTALANGLGVNPNILVGLARGESLEYAQHQLELDKAEKHVQANVKALTSGIVNEFQRAKSGFQGYMDSMHWIKRKVRGEAAKIAEQLGALNEEVIQRIANLLEEGLTSQVELPLYPPGMEESEPYTLEDVVKNPLMTGIVQAGTPYYPKGLQDPLDEWERAVLERLSSIDFGDADPRRDATLWSEPKAVRRRILRSLEDVWYEHQARAERRAGIRLLGDRP